jgi:hypothetical protein
MVLFRASRVRGTVVRDIFVVVARETREELWEIHEPRFMNETRTLDFYF